MRYVIQPDKISCGPTAIINALKWAGVPTSLQDLPKIQFSCKTVNPVDPTNVEAAGTYDHDFDRTLRYAGAPVFTVKKKSRPSFKSVKDHLAGGGAICIGYWWMEEGEENAHFAFIEGLKGSRWIVVNDHASTKEPTKLRNEKTVRKWLTTRKNGCPAVWFLTRK